jgi:phosphoribosylformylglycinamidine (FGAM) synthase PurS component
LVTLHAEAYTNVSAAVLGGMVFSFALDKNEILVKSTEKKLKCSTSSLLQFPVVESWIKA